MGPLADAKVSGWLIACSIVFAHVGASDRSLYLVLPVWRGYAAAAAAPVVVALLRGRLSCNTNVAEQGFRAIAAMAVDNADNNSELGAAGACKGE